MKSHTSLVAQQTRLSEWADLIRDYQNHPQGMKNDEWCQLHDITKASYYWRLRKVREAYLETADHLEGGFHESKFYAFYGGENVFWNFLVIDNNQLLSLGLVLLI